MTLFKNGKLWRNLALVLVAGCVVFGVSWRLANPPSGPINTPEDLLQRLQEKGLDYEGKRIKRGKAVFQNEGYYLKRIRDSRSFEELAAEPLPQKINGLVLVAYPEPGVVPGGGDVTVGRLWLRGDRGEILRIIEALK